MMISKPLFNHSCKSNAGLWSFVTCITCGMLAVVILVLGNLNVSGVRNSMIRTFTKDAIECVIEKQSVTYFNMTESALIGYEQEKENNQDLKLIADSYKDIRQTLTEESFENADQLARENITKDLEEDKIYLVNLFIDFCLTNEYGEINKANYNFEIEPKYSLFMINNVVDSLYEKMLIEEGDETAAEAKHFIDEAIREYLTQTAYSISDFATYYIPEVLKDVFTKEAFNYQDENLWIKDYLSTEEIKFISLEAIKNFKAKVEIEREELVKTSNPELSDVELNLIVGEKLSQFKDKYINEMSGGLLNDLPKEVSTALSELGGLDIYALVISEVFYRMAGMLLPMVFVILCSNNLVASQIDSGSMAYLLSTPTKRKKVMLTQAIYLISALFIMCLLTAITGLICLNLTNSTEITINNHQLILFNIGFFVTLFSIAGICFMSSCWFNKSKIAMSVGGGISVFFLMITILGLFGLEVMPSMIRINAMDFFNHISLISLFDTTSILNGTTSFIWKWLILIFIGIITFIIGIKKFIRKDLPL